MADTNTDCFLERQQILFECESTALEVPESERYAFVFEQLLDRSSPPIEPDDVFLGRMVEGPCPDPSAPPALHGSFIHSMGHATLDWPELLTKGLSRIGADIRARAVRQNTGEGTAFAAQSTRCIDAVLRFAGRYRVAARQASSSATPETAFLLRQAAEALEVCPKGPVRDFFSALQSLWLIPSWLSASWYLRISG